MLPATSSFPQPRSTLASPLPRTFPTPAPRLALTRPCLALAFPAVPRDDSQDPCIWRDHRGNFHALFHFSHGHAWSPDGLVWHWGGGKAAWQTTVRMADGSVEVWRDSERPRVWVNPESGLPELLFVASGVNSQPTKRGQGQKGFLVVQAINTHG